MRQHAGQGNCRQPCARLCVASRPAARVDASDVRRCIERSSSLHERVVARPCLPRRPACWPARRALSEAPVRVVALGACAAPLRAAPKRRIPSISRRGDPQNLAARLDPKRVAVLVDEFPQDLSRRSSSAWAKNALATFKISLARCSSLFSRSSSLTRCAYDVVTPSRTPVSISTRLTHVSSDCGTQPIFGAIDSTANHSDRYSPRCSCTRRTARSRTSG